MTAKKRAVKQPVKRSYESPYRLEQAAQTRLRILREAIALFSENGYAATTLDEVALAAGVSRPTVFAAVGSKRALISKARDVALVGDDEPVPMPERPWMHALRAEPDAGRALRIYAGAMSEIHGRAARLELAITSAAEPDLQELSRTARAQRRFGCRLITDVVATKRRLRRGLTAETAADIMFATASPEVYDLLVSVRSWSPKRYEEWLASTLEQQLF